MIDAHIPGSSEVGVNEVPSLLGIGLYTPSEAGRLIGVPSQRLLRWLKGHAIGARSYEPLWSPQIEIEDEGTFLSFLDLIQARIADGLIGAGVSAQKVRRAIIIGREILKSDYPFASARFRTDGKTVVLQVLVPGEDDALIDLFRNQYLLNKIVEPSFKHLDFADDIAVRWWPKGKAFGIVVDPRRQFGQPIDNDTGVPTAVLAAAAKAEGSVAGAARAYRVPPAAVRRAVQFEQKFAA